MNPIDAACEVLRATSDGDDLSRLDLYLVEAAVQNNLNELGELRFQELHQAVTAGTYVRPALAGVEHLDQDHEGYVYWKGQRVEHYSYLDSAREREAALQLAANCCTLEEKDFPVNSRTAISPEVLEAPKDTPWLEALCHYYAFFVKADRVKAIFYKTTRQDGVAVLEKRLDGALEIETFADTFGAYDAYHAVIAQGFESAAPYRGYAHIVQLLERSRLTPEELHASIV